MFFLHEGLVMRKAFPYLDVIKHFGPALDELTHWGRVTHICVSKLIIIGSDNGLSPDRRQAIIWTNAGLLLIGPLWPNFSKILIGIHTFAFIKMDLKVSSAKWRPYCPGLNVLTSWRQVINNLSDDIQWKVYKFPGDCDRLISIMAFPMLVRWHRLDKREKT